MVYTTLISPADLLPHLDDPNWAIVDCRFSLGDPERGRNGYLRAHIPGAVYAHLNEDLCAPHIPGVTGRHPLPSPEQLAQKFSDWGIGPGVQVVAYDDWEAASGGVAARLWWSLRWLGHEAVAVLDGGWKKWLEQGCPWRSGWEARPLKTFIPKPRPELVVSASQVEALRLDTAYRVVDSRSADRYRGENETIDPVPGHIPGAINIPYTENVGTDGLFKAREELSARYSALLGAVPAQNVIFYCGSGVTACHNLLAMLHAGLGEARLYVGSWSDWITDASRPVARGS